MQGQPPASGKTKQFAADTGQERVSALAGRVIKAINDTVLDQLITAQLYFQGDEHVADDIASAVKPELILAPTERADGKDREVTYDFILDPQTNPGLTYGP